MTRSSSASTSALNWIELNWKTKWLSSPHCNPLIWHPVTSFSKNEIEAERTQVWYHWGDTGRIAESAWRSDRKDFQEAFQKWRRRWDRCLHYGTGVYIMGPVSTLWDRCLHYGTGVYMRDGTTARVTAADRPYGEFYDFYSVSPENFGYHLVHTHTYIRT